METNMRPETDENVPESTPQRMTAFSDGVFAIVITIMILELKHPSSATFRALFAAWPQWISYIVSYTFIAIVWINHHYLLKHATKATPRLIWANFAHLFTVSLIPFLIEWIAETKLDSVPVMMYAFVFLLVNVTYLVLIRETLYTKSNLKISDETRRRLYKRAKWTILVFAGAMVAAIWFPYLGFLMICICLIIYLRPGVRKS